MISLLALKIPGIPCQNILWKSPCYPIIDIHNKYKVPFYYCKLHPDIENIHLESIEHHCKFSDPEYHKSEVLKFLEKILASYERLIETK